MRTIEQLITKFKSDAIRIIDRKMIRFLKLQEQQYKLSSSSKKYRTKLDKIHLDIYVLLADLMPFHEILEEKYPEAIELYQLLHQTLRN